MREMLKEGIILLIIIITTLLTGYILYNFYHIAEVNIEFHQAASEYELDFLKCRTIYPNQSYDQINCVNIALDKYLTRLKEINEKF